MVTDVGSLAQMTGMNVYLLVVIMAWSLCWKLAALWKSARKGSLIWFIILGVVNTIGILEILYIFVFSELKLEEPKKQTKRKAKPKSVKKKKSKKKK